MRRPSAAMLVALLALFVALGGPAQAKHLINGKDIRKGTVRSAQIKDKSLTTRDLSAATVRTLQTTPDVDRDRQAGTGRRHRRPARRRRGRRARDRRRDRGGRRRGRRRRRPPASSPTAPSPARRSPTAGDRRQDRRRLADDGGHRPLLGRVPDRRRGPGDDRAARLLEPRAARARAGGRRRRHLPGRAARLAALHLQRPPAELQLPDVGTQRERSRRRQPLRADALQPDRRAGSPPGIAFSYIVFDLSRAYARATRSADAG